MKQKNYSLSSSNESNKHSYFIYSIHIYIYIYIILLAHNKIMFKKIVFNCTVCNICMRRFIIFVFYIRGMPKYCAFTIEIVILKLLKNSIKNGLKNCVIIFHLSMKNYRLLPTQIICFVVLV